MQTLKIKDLSASRELDREAMSAVSGGENQTNANTMAGAIANDVTTAVGNGSLFNGSTVFNVDGSSHNKLDQDVYQYNKDSFGLDLLRVAPH